MNALWILVLFVGSPGPAAAPSAFAHAQVSMDPGSTLLAANDAPGAAEIYRQAAAELKAECGESLDWAQALDGLGLALHAQGQLNPAAEAWESSLAARQRLAPGSLAHAHSLNLVGQIARLRGDYNRAETL